MSNHPDQHSFESKLVTEPVPAAQYVRMSTEHQQYSTENQGDVIREYAARRGFTIVRTYADEGRSGLNIGGRESLQQLLTDVQAGNTNFKAILVYDVSRWGRFQDADESAYYEYSCRRVGIDVHYCSEQFENDGKPVSTIIKSVKRAMAAEYSRELSSKVFMGQCRLIELGYRQGGMAGFGLRRMLVDITGQPKGLLEIGQHKSLQTDRVILVPGPDDEVQTVLWMYRAFADDGKSEGEIAAALNERGLLTDLGRPWSRGAVRQVLTNEKYIGNNVYNRTSFKLKVKHVRNPPEIWVRSDRAFEGIIDPDLFYIVRGIIRERNRRLSDEELLAKMRMLLSQHATISAHLIDTDESMPPSSTYRTRFGSLLEAYRRAGYSPDRDFGYLEINRTIRSVYPAFVRDVVDRLGSVGATVTQDPTGLMLINNEYSAALTLSRYRETAGGAPRWLIHFRQRVIPDITVLIRLDDDNRSLVDVYLLPVMDIAFPRLLLCETNGAHLDTYQFDSLDRFAKLAARRKIEVAA